MNILFMLHGSEGVCGPRNRQTVIIKELSKKHKIYVTQTEHSIYRENVDPLVTPIKVPSFKYVFSEEEIHTIIKKYTIHAIVDDYRTKLPSGYRLPIPSLYIGHGLITEKFGISQYREIYLQNRTYDFEIISSFYQGDCPPIYNKDIFIEQNPRNSNEKDYYIVYIRFSVQEQILPFLKNSILQKYPVCYLENYTSEDHTPSYISILQNCRGVICTGGHQLPAECFRLQKPVLAFPSFCRVSLDDPNKHTFLLDKEQELNARMVEKAGFGVFCDFPLVNFNEKFLEFHKKIDEGYFNFKDSQFSKDGIQFDFTDGTSTCMSKIEEFLKKL